MPLAGSRGGTPWQTDIDLRAFAGADGGEDCVSAEGFGEHFAHEDGEEDDGEAHADLQGETLVVEEHGERDSEHAFQAEDEGGGDGRGVFDADVHHDETEAGRHHGDIDEGAYAALRERRGETLLCEEKDGADDEGGEELHGGEKQGVELCAELVHGDDLQREEHPAYEGISLPFQREPDAAVQTDQPYARNGDDRRGDVEKGGTLPRDRPPDEGNEHAIDGGEEGAGAGGGVLQA